MNTASETVFPVTPADQRQPIVHDLKTWPAFFDAVARGEKRFELRRNDRDFRSGDAVRLREWNPDASNYTGRMVSAKVGYITDWPGSLLPGHVCFELEQVSLC